MSDDPFHCSMPPTVEELVREFRRGVGMKLSALEQNEARFLKACRDCRDRIEIDRSTLSKAVSLSRFKIKLEDFLRSEHVIRWGFLLRNEFLDSETKWLQHNLAHFTMAAEVLNLELLEVVEHHVRRIVRQINALLWPISWEQLDGLQGTMADLSRLWSGCANILEVLEAYDRAYGFARELVDEDFQYDPPRKCSAHIYEFEFGDATKALLLSNGAGRHATAPLTRTEIEILVTRLIRTPMKGSKFEGKCIKATRRLNADAVANAAKTRRVPLVLGAESLKRLYEWGSISVHLGYRYPTQELWYAHLYAHFLRQGLVASDDESAVRLFDEMIDQLLKKQMVTIEDEA